MPGLPVARNNNLQQSNTPVPVAGTGPDGVLGGVKVDGSSIAIDPTDGVISVAGGGGGNISGTGTPGTVPIFTGAHTLGDSPISASGASGLVAAPLIIQDPNGGTQVSLAVTPDFTGAEATYDLLDLVDEDLVGPVTQLTALFIDISSGAKNTAIGISSDLPAGADNFAIDSQSPAQSSFAGLVGMPSLVLTPVATDPSSPTDGELWYNSTVNRFKGFFNGAASILFGSLESHIAAASTELDFTSWFNSAIDNYEIVFENIQTSAATEILLQVGLSGVYDSSNVYETLVYGYSSGGSSLFGATSTSGQLFPFAGLGRTTVASPSLNPFSGRLKFMLPGSATYKTFMGSVYGQDSANVATVAQRVDTTIQYSAVTAFNNIRIFTAAGNLASGTIRIVGSAN